MGIVSSRPAVSLSGAGLSTWEEFGELTFHLQRAVTEAEPLTDLDWARVLFLTEITWACYVPAGHRNA